MPKRRNRTFFDESALTNTRNYILYFNRLLELSISMFEWKNLPDTIDDRFLEYTLFMDGNAVFFKDEELGYLALQCAINGSFNVYRIPIRRRAYAVNGYQRELTDKDSVIIYNNEIRTNSVELVRVFAQRLWDFDCIIGVNARAQKTPVLIQGTEQQRLTLLNLYKEYDGNSPVIFGDKNLDINALKCLKTDAPYVGDKLYQLKTQYWNEALTHLGISNINIQKKERLITDEVTRNQGGTIASRYSRLESRREAVEKINDMFGTNIEVNYREDFQQVDDDTIPEESGADTIGGEGNE
jgi:hypothetical protein